MGVKGLGRAGEGGSGEGGGYGDQKLERGWRDTAVYRIHRRSCS